MKIILQNTSLVFRSQSIPADIEAALDIYTNASKADKSAFATFVEAIGGTSGSIYGKIDYLLIPNFSSSVVEALTNVKTKSLDSNNYDATTVSQYWSLTNGYVKAISPKKAQLPTRKRSENTVFGIAKKLTDNTSGRFFDLNGGYVGKMSGTALTIQCPLVDGINGNFTPSGDSYTRSGNILLLGLSETDSTHVNCYARTGNRGSLVSDNDVVIDSTPSAVTTFSPFGTTTSFDTDSEWILTGVAKGLTKSEMQTLYSALLTLYDYMIAKYSA